MTPALTIVSYNIHLGRDIEDVLDLARVADVIRALDADVVALQEVGRHWSTETDFADQPAELKRLLEMDGAFGANLDRDPPQPGGPRRQYGTAILSRWPVVSSEHVLLPRVSTDNEQRGLLVLDIDVDGSRFRVHNAHMSVVAADRTLQVQAVLDEADKADVPHVVVGDFNARPAEPELAPLFGRYEDAWATAGRGEGFTFPAIEPKSRIDYVLVSAELAVSDVRVPAQAGSDHRPLVAQVAATG